MVLDFIENHKTVLGIIASVVAIGAYIPYFRDIFKGKTKPHIFSWLIWSLLGGIAYTAQVVKGAGAGSWQNGIVTLIYLFIAVLAVFRGEKNIALTDKLAFGGAILALGLWAITANPLLAVILASLTDTIAYIPTFRKAYHKPGEETLSAFTMSAIAIFISLFALEAYSPTTWLYLVCLLISDSAFIIMLMARRNVIKNRRNI